MLIITQMMKAMRKMARDMLYMSWVQDVYERYFLKYVCRAIRASLARKPLSVPTRT